jgi:hypothetical protein
VIAATTIGMRVVGTMTRHARIPSLYHCLR